MPDNTDAPQQDQTPETTAPITEPASHPEEDTLLVTTEPTQNLDYAQLSRLLESLLFVAGEPAPIERLASALDAPEEQIETALTLLAETLRTRGIRLQRHHNTVQLVSMPEASDAIEVYLGLDLTTKLSRAALETLAIIAYRQPMTRPQIEAIRGVSSDGVIRTLLHRGLVQEVGRLETAGRPMLFGTTPDFLNYFGISSLEELPPLEDEDVDALTERIEMMGAGAEEENIETKETDDSRGERT